MTTDVVVDIECIPIAPPQRLIDAELEKFDKAQAKAKAEYRAPRNYKDPVKIEQHALEFAAKQQEDRESFLKTVEYDLVEKNRFKAPFNQVVAIGVCSDPYVTDEELEVTAFAGAEPRELIEQFVDYLNNIQYGARLVGWNIEGYDYPILLKYMMRYEIHLEHTLDRYGILDLCYKPFRGIGLKDMAESIGMPPLTVEGRVVNGSSVEDIVKAGSWDLLKEYVTDDVKKTSSILRRASRVQKL